MVPGRRPISVPHGDRIKTALGNAIAEVRPRIAIETGTYDGEGSTKLLINSFGSNAPESFYTIECSKELHALAKRRLAIYPYVQCVHGLSVRRAEAIQHIRNDPWLLRPDEVPNLYGEVPNPQQFYLAEVSCLESGDIEEDYLRFLLQKHKSLPLLIALDSCGGTGLLEFRIVDRTLRSQEYVLLLDDINHVKHYRSFEEVVRRRDFRVIDCDFIDGWLVAVHSPMEAIGVTSSNSSIAYCKCYLD
jgi:hypothetical protein